jgi:adenosine deaminase
VKGLLADCHLHFEGCLPAPEIARLAVRAGHTFAEPGAFEAACQGVHDAPGFLSLYAEICRLFRSPEDYAEAARAVARFLASDGIAYAEIYVSPEIFARLGLPAAECLAAAAEGLAQEAEQLGIRCRILLDVVRHWGPEAADRVLDLYEKQPLAAVVGFGMGGDEGSVPAAAFAGVYLRARALGLRTVAHAGEWCGPEAVREVLDELRPDRLDHGIAAARDARLLDRLAEEGTILCVAPSGNLRTGAVSRIEEHPLPRLLEKGVAVTLSADDPVFFSTTTRGEYRLARAAFGLGDRTLRRLAENGWKAAFCQSELREEGLRRIEQAWPNASL